MPRLAPIKKNPNGCLQQIAANRFSTPQDVIAILLQGLVRHALLLLTVWLGVGLYAKCLGQLDLRIGDPVVKLCANGIHAKGVFWLNSDSHKLLA